MAKSSTGEMLHRVERPEIEAPVEDKADETVIEEEIEFSKCGRSPKAHITLTGWHQSNISLHLQQSLLYCHCYHHIHGRPSS